MVARSAVTLVVPFAAYILAEEVHASGVIAVVVTALEMQRHSRPAGCRRAGHPDGLLGRGGAAGHRAWPSAWWGWKSGRSSARKAPRIFGMIGTAVVVCVLVFAVRFALAGHAGRLSGRKRKDVLQPTSAKEVLILTWCGMRGLATLALALALPLTLADGTPFPARDQLLVIACAVLLATLVLPGLTLPWLMRVLKASEDGSEERDAARVLARRAQAGGRRRAQGPRADEGAAAGEGGAGEGEDEPTNAELLDGSLRNESAGGEANARPRTRHCHARPSPSTRPARRSSRPATSRAWTPKSRTGCCGSWICAP